MSPREVDEVLMDHPAVAQVVTRSAMPHAKLGEEVAAAVVLREGRNSASRRCAPSLATRPGRLQGAAQGVFMAEIPKGATGKLQRIGLAAKLGLGSIVQRGAPSAFHWRSFPRCPMCRWSTPCTCGFCISSRA
jgi:acyl-coenzyme A synthetase/AMP-(fatty) acid ligase